MCLNDYGIGVFAAWFEGMREGSDDLLVKLTMTGGSSLCAELSGSFKEQKKAQRE